MFANLSVYTAAISLAFGVFYAVPAWAAQAETVTPRFEGVVPNVPGKSLVVVEVDYAPGAASPPHKHARSAFVYAYVISGEIESQVNGAAARIYKAGESWSEPPGAIHTISRNASGNAPAKLFAVFVVDTDDKVLTTPEHR